MYKIFLVEDDEGLVKHVKDFLEKYSYEVFTVEDFKDIEAEFDRVKPHLVLLDINLPYYDGFYICKILRKRSNVPIIIISARTSEVEQVMGMEFGADDYITKPFSFQLLLAKLKANIRRNYRMLKDENTLKINGLYLNDRNFNMYFDRKNIALTKNEFKLLKKLMENKDNVVTREELLEVLWDNELFVEDNTLNVNVTRVRNRLKEIGIKGAIKTKRGIGYSLDSNMIG
ncbi:response regulator transcription factor [Dethiothermospora halolimnae]|uniref:response regulator transcription factor n=1 Tax=Dethiothermospora halolimnae TaxID=3114390 RepID=UPI003CCC0FBB